MARKVEAMQAAPDPISMMMQMADNMPLQAQKAKSKDNRTVSQLREAGQMGKKEIPQMSREAFEKMEQSGRFPEKMMQAIKQGQRWYKMDQKQRKGKPNQSKDNAKGMPKDSSARYSRSQINLAQAITTVEHALENVGKYSDALRKSPENELAQLVNALAGGYTAPSPGGDPIVNPNTLPTGRNLFSINVENTPTEEAWEKAKEVLKTDG